MRLRAIALLTLLAITCGGPRQQRVAPDALYREGRTALWHDFDQAELIARRGADQFSADPQWRELFSILRAEAMARRGDNEVLAVLQAAPTTGNREAAVRRHLVRGYALLNAGRFPAAAAEYARAEALAPPNDTSLRAEVAVLSIAPPFRNGDYDLAERYARQALELGRASNHTFVVVNALGMLGTIESNRREFQQALDHLNEALRLARFVNASSESTIVGNIGWCYMQLGDVDEALRCYREALDYAVRHDVTRTQPTWLTNMSNIYLARQQFDEALPYAERAVDAARKTGEQAKLASALGNLALIDVELGRTDVAEARNRDAMALREKYDQKLLPYSRLTEARIATATGSAGTAVGELEAIAAGAGKDPELRWQAQAAAAAAYKNLGRLSDAERMYEAALDTGDNARARRTEESYLFAFESNLIRFYDEYIDLLLGQQRIADALRVAERSRARTLRQGIGLLEREEHFAPAELARTTHATILSYWLAPRRSLLWVVTPGGVDVKLLPPAATIEQEIDAYRTELQSSRHSLTSARGAELYAMLVAPAKVTPGSRVIVVPDGHLNAINLETVIAPSPQPHYWIDDATVSYTPSLQLLARATAWHGVRDARLLVFGDVPGEGREFPPLPRARAEIAMVSQHFERDRCVVVQQAKATPAAYAALDLRPFDFLHFAAHGTASVRSPLESAVILAPGAGGYRLSGRQIVSVPLAAQLVTVSSCNSAGQRSYAGEGLVGLAWAFLRAGAQRVVAAQWEVSDSATPALMDSMYAALGRGSEPAAALREAKLALLHSNQVYKRPFYWAPFVLYGAV